MSKNDVHYYHDCPHGQAGVLDIPGPALSLLFANGRLWTAFARIGPGMGLRAKAIETSLKSA